MILSKLRETRRGTKNLNGQSHKEVYPYEVFIQVLDGENPWHEVHTLHDSIVLWLVKNSKQLSEWDSTIFSRGNLHVAVFWLKSKTLAVELKLRWAGKRV